VALPERYQPPAEVWKTLGQMPHCDPQILHRPKTCEYCDKHPVWQALREAYEINFTGEDDPKKSPCPSSKYRPAYMAHRWHGNHPTNADVPLQAPTAWEHLEHEDDEE